MNDSDIVNIIKDIEKQYNDYKDEGRSFIQHLANKIQNTVDEDKVLIFDFFLDEIEKNNNGLYSIALQTIIELKQIIDNFGVVRSLDAFVITGNNLRNINNVINLR